MNDEKISEGLCPYPNVFNNKCLCVGRDAHIPPFKIKNEIAQSFSKEVDFRKAKRRGIVFSLLPQRIIAEKTHAENPAWVLML
ncbi:MAG: hypothetical protein IJE48_04420 [Clostridia bacterium]|nr:hypothetical protein [Clostridia bacterium]